MNIKNCQEKINRTDWKRFSGPEYFEPDRVADALISLISLHDEEQGNSVYNKVLFAIGNNHAGTYYPAVEEALKYIVETAISGNTEVAKNCALDILIDLYASFDPELGNYTYVTAGKLQNRVSDIIESVKKELEILSDSPAESLRNRALANYLLECISEIEMEKAG